MNKTSFTPVTLEKIWIDTENKIAEKLSTFSAIVLFFSLFFLGGAYFGYGTWTTLPLPAWGRFFIAQDRYWASIVLLAGAFFHYLLNPKGKLNILVLSSIVTASWLFPLSKLQAIRIEAFYPILFVFLCSSILKFVKTKKVFLLFFFIGIFILLVFGLYQAAATTHNGKVLQYFSVLHLDVLLLYFIQRLFVGQNLEPDFDFNPLQLYLPLPIPAESTLSSKKAERKLLFVKGCIQIAQAQIIFLILLTIVSKQYFRETENPYSHYLVFLFLVACGMKMVTGLLWAYGFKTPPASYFIFLAKSPLEIWQRGSTYLAKFAFFNIYLPIWKRVRNSFFPSAAVLAFVFFHLFFFHEVLIKKIISLFIPGIVVAGLSPEVLMQQLIWLAIWLIWIFCFLFVLKKYPLAIHGRFSSWFLVLLTHLGSASVIPVTFYLMERIFK